MRNISICTYTAARKKSGGRRAGLAWRRGGGAEERPGWLGPAVWAIDLGRRPLPAGLGCAGLLNTVNIFAWRRSRHSPPSPETWPGRQPSPPPGASSPAQLASPALQPSAFPPRRILRIDQLIYTVCM